MDVRLRDDGSALLTWLERTDGDAAELRVARIEAGAGVTGEWVVARSSSARASGFPRMTLVPGEPSAALVAWTDVSDAQNPRVRIMRMELP